MSNVILCTTRRAEKPFHIGLVGLNIYSAEELCYFCEQNLYLIDESIMNRELLDWLKDELHMRRLVQKLYPQLHAALSIPAFILPIFREVNYFRGEEAKEFQERLEQMMQQAPIMRRKMKGDALMKHGKYLEAIHVYQRILGDLDDTSLGSQLLGNIYHNLGCGFANLFEMQEAVVSFREADRRLHTAKTIRSLLFAVYLAEGRESYEKLCEESRIDPDTKKEMDEKIIRAVQTALPEDPEQALEKWIQDYHRSTGL